jgi:hypothetical protein
LLETDYWLDPNPKIFDLVVNYINESISKKEYLIDVDSAFGGIAIYKLSAIPADCNYSGLKPTGEEDCEHVEFHKCLKKNGAKIYINTEFYNK